MAHLTAQDAITPSILMVSADMRFCDLDSPSELRSYEAYAVFSDMADQHSPEHFLGIVPKHMIGRYPYRIFADLLTFSKSTQVEPSTPLDKLYSEFQQHGFDALSVMEIGQRFIGVVTPTSLLEALWHREQFLTSCLRKEIDAKKAAEQKLQSTQDELESQLGTHVDVMFAHQQQLRSLSENLLSAEKLERQALANELHDQLAQMLAVSRMKLAQVSQLTKNSEILDLLKTVDHYLHESLTYTRSLMTELNTFQLHQSGLLTALDGLTKKMSLFGLTVTIHAEQPLPDLSENQVFLIFGSLRELLFNVIKHAQVDQATITIQQLHGTHLECLVSDHGPGFDPAQLSLPNAAQDHFGLSSIEGRMAALQGTLALDSFPGKGTRVTLTIPLSPHSPPA